MLSSSGSGRRPTCIDVDGLPRRPRARRSASCQALALIPGVSRSGATIVGGDADAGSIGRPRPSSRSSSRCRRWRRRSRTTCWRCGTTSASARGARDRGRLRDGRSSRRCWSSSRSCSYRRGDRASRRSPGTASRSGWRCSRRSLPAGCRTRHAVAAPRASSPGSSSRCRCSSASRRSSGSSASSTA